MKASKILCLLAILLFFAFGTAQASQASITFDEGPHLTAGYTIWRTGDYRLQPVHIHPPLANLMASLPTLLLSDIPDPSNIDGWDIASLSALTDATVWQYPAPARLIFPSRVPMLFSGVLLLAVVYRWMRVLAGWHTANIAIFMLALDPNLIAHSALVTTDITATLTIVLSLFSLSHYAKSKPGSGTASKQALLLGVAAGAAQLAKTSGIIILPFISVLGLLRFTKAISSKQRKLWLRVMGEGAIIIGMTALVLWAGYGFQVGDFHGVRIPAAMHLRMFESFRQHYNLGHSAYALGRISEGGWLWYFPLAFVMKTPLLTLITLICVTVSAVIHAFKSRSEPIALDQWLLAAFIGVYTGTSLFSSVNIGYRHLLPLLPPLCMLIAISLSQIEIRTNSVHWQRIAYIAFATALLVPLMRSAPYPLTFFNLLIGNKSNAAAYLVDSNLDWGQNWWDLRDWQRENDSGTINVAHYSPAHLETYGLDALYLPPSPKAVEFTPWAPKPAMYAIGATVMQGAYVADANTYAWFRNQEPLDRLGNAIYVYEVVTLDVPDVLISCTPHNTEYFTGRYGELIDRIVRPDCARTAVYPVEPNTHYFTTGTDSLLGTANEILSLRNANGSIENRLIHVAPPSPQHRLDVSLDGPLTLLGYDLNVKDSEIQLHTYWRVTSVPTRPLSLMAHLVDNTGMLIEVDDGLGLSIDQWQVGDLLAQKHALGGEHPTQDTINIGVYWLDTMERWPIPSGGDHIVIEIPD